MVAHADSLKNISFVYPLEYFRPRGRNAISAWAMGSTPVMIRRVVRSELQIAFRIHWRNRSEAPPIDVYTQMEAEGLWWPVGSENPSVEMDRFFDALKKGSNGTLTMIASNLAMPQGVHSIGPADLNIRIKQSDFDDMVRPVEQAALNVLIVDDRSVYVRGGNPVYFWYQTVAENRKSTRIIADVANSGFEFGRPMPATILGDGTSSQDVRRIYRSFRNGHYHTTDQIDELSRQIVQSGHALFDPPIIEVLLTNWRPSDLIELQVRRWSRELLEQLQEKHNNFRERNLPHEMFQDLKLFQVAHSGRNPSASECATLIENFKDWQQNLGEDVRFRFGREYRFATRATKSIEAYCKQSGITSPFDDILTQEEEDYLAGLRI